MGVSSTVNDEEFWSDAAVDRFNREQRELARKAASEAQLSKLSQSERDYLQRFARETGAAWRSKLCLEWMRGSLVLREARNSIGPHGIYRVRFPRLGAES